MKLVVKEILRERIRPRPDLTRAQIEEAVEFISDAIRRDLTAGLFQMYTILLEENVVKLLKGPSNEHE